jgi:2-methylisocitrate lyase-like PEP mutase family enzyme
VATYATNSKQVEAEMPNQSEKGVAFRALHASKQLFIIPNPWDVGSARVLEGLGFLALATTSSGLASSLGMVDGQPGREAVLQHARALTQATSIPISADLENGFGDEPEVVAETIRLAAAAGLVGGSIEDYTGRPDQPLYPLTQATERVHAAVEAAAALGFPFTVTARAENLLRMKPDLDETIRRLQAYQAVGAPVLFAPGVRSREDIQSILREVERPLNVLAGARELDLSIPQLAELGVRRVSVGGIFSRLAYGALIQAARELKDTGTFGFMGEVARARDLNTLLRR